MVEIILSPRKSGKTAKLIEQCAEKGGYIVCFDHDEAYRIAQRAREMGLFIPFPLTSVEFFERSYFGRNIKQFYIDNADIILQGLTSVPIATITLTDKRPQV